MAAAVVELNSLPDAVGAAAENDDLLLVGWRGLVFFFVGRVEIGRVALEFGRASVHALVNGFQVVLLAGVSELGSGVAAALDTEQVADANVGKSGALGFAQQFAGNRLRPELRYLFRDVVDLLQLVEEPRVDRGHLVDL